MTPLAHKKTFETIALATGAGLLLWAGYRAWSNKGAPKDGLDPNLSPDARAAVHAALVMETDSSVLARFAEHLHDAGHWISARLVSHRAAELLGASPSVVEGHP